MSTREFRCESCDMTFRTKKEKDAHLKKTHRRTDSKKRIPPSQKGGAVSEAVAFD